MVGFSEHEVERFLGELGIWNLLNMSQSSQVLQCSFIRFMLYCKGLLALTHIFLASVQSLGVFPQNHGAAHWGRTEISQVL
jgi:hypothetical protein